jgi:hypothetical protein
VTKTLTRRLGWRDLKPGTLLQAQIPGQADPNAGTKKPEEKAKVTE